LTEREAMEKVQQAAQVKDIPFAESLLTSTLYRFLRGQQDPIAVREESLPRVPVEEYREELSETVRELRAAGAKVVLVSEPTVDEGELGYRDAMQQVASSESALFIPVAEDLAQSKDPLLFGRGKILSDKGYNAVASSMSRYLSSFVGAPVVPDGQDPEQSSDPQNSTLGVQGQQVKMVVRPSDVNGDLVFKLRMPEQGTRFYRVAFSANGQFVADKRLDSRDSVRVRFQLPEQYRSLPIVELAVRTVASPPLESDRIGSSSVYVPVPMSVSMENGRETSIKVGQSSLYSVEPFSALAVDPRSGDILSSVRAKDALELSSWSRTLPWGAMVVGALATPSDLDPTTATGLKGISGGVSLPPRGERTAFVGLVGGAKADLLMQSGKDSLSLAVGSPIVSAYNRFILEEVEVNDQPLKRLDA
jgi:hypothetical protein